MINAQIQPGADGGMWPDDDLRRAFVAGAAWMYYQTVGATMWRTERDEAEIEAEHRYPGGQPPDKIINLRG